MTAADLLLYLALAGAQPDKPVETGVPAFLGKYDLFKGIHRVGTTEVREGTRGVSYVVITQLTDGSGVHEVELLLRVSDQAGRFHVERKETPPGLRAREGQARAMGGDLVFEFSVHRPDNRVTLLRETWHRRSDGTLLLRSEAGEDKESLWFVGSVIAERR